MYRQNQTIVNMLEPVISAMGFELWGIEQVQDGRDSLLRIYIDHSDGIDLDDCTRVSRQVVGVLDVEDPISGSYRLEVSSPGLDRPFFTLAQLSRFEGQQAQIHLREKLRERRQLKGEISQVVDDVVTLISDGEEFIISETMIDKANLLPF